MSNLVDIIEGIISQIDLNLTVKSTDGQVIELCDTLHITVGKIVKDELGNEYRVTDIVFNESITVVPIDSAPLFSGSTVVAPEITFLHGSPISTNEEYNKVLDRDSLKKTPFIWLLESYEYENGSRDSSIVASYSARLFFLDLYYREWLNDEHNELAIKPMENLVRAFKNVIETDYSFKTLDSFRSRVRPRFGVEVANKGSRDKIINEDLSGVEVNISIELFDLSICKC